MQRKTSKRFPKDLVRTTGALRTSSHAPREVLEHRGVWVGRTAGEWAAGRQLASQSFFLSSCSGLGFFMSLHSEQSGRGRSGAGWESSSASVLAKWHPLPCSSLIDKTVDNRKSPVFSCSQTPVPFSSLIQESKTFAVYTISGIKATYYFARPPSQSTTDWGGLDKRCTVSQFSRLEAQGAGVGRVRSFWGREGESAPRGPSSPAGWLAVCDTPCLVETSLPSVFPSAHSIVPVSPHTVFRRGYLCHAQVSPFSKDCIPTGWGLTLMTAVQVDDFCKESGCKYSCLLSSQGLGLFPGKPFNPQQSPGEAGNTVQWCNYRK